MKINTSELTGAALDWAVAKITNPEWGEEGWLVHCTYPDDDGWVYRPSTDWVQGGAIIERERVELEHDGYAWWARIKADDDYTGPTPLIAAMRCYVAFHLGDEVDVPDELILLGEIK